MKLEKNKRSAVILSGVTVLSFSITSAILNLLIPILATGDIGLVAAGSEGLSQPGSAPGLALFIAALLILLTGIGAFWLYQFFGERYYGPRSAPRWAVFGILFALFLKLPDWLFPPELWLLKGLVQLAGLFAAFFLARWLIPFQRATVRQNE